MENIDDFMRQKFDSDDPQERFEFQEEYWEQAQALLEREEHRRRRRVWYFLLLVLAMALLAWFLVLPWGDGALSENKGKEEQSTFLSENSENQSAEQRSSALTENTENPANTNGKTTMGEPTMKLSEPESVEESIQRERNRSASFVSEKPSKGTQQNRVGNKSLAKTGKSDNAGGVARLSDEQVAAGRNTISSPAAQSARPVQAGQTKIENTSSAIANPPTTTPPITNPPITTPPITNPPITTPPITTPPALIPTFNIPTPLTLFPIPEPALVPLKPWILAKEPIAKITKPVKNQRFAFGLTMAGAAYQSSDTMGRWAGWAIGLFGKYRLNKNWSLMLGIQERFVPGFGAPVESSNPGETVQLRYSFGFKREEWKRETRGLHYLEIPLSAQWHKGPWGLEAGGAGGMLLAVQNSTTYTVESSLEAAKTTVKKFTKGDTKPYNQTYFSGFAGAEYRLNNRISVMARGQYRFTPVLKSLGEGVANKGLGNVELGLRARLF